MAAAAILDILNCKFSQAARVQRADTHHCSKYVKIGKSIVKILQFLPRDAMLSAVYAFVVCVCVSVCLSVCHTLVLYHNG